MAILIVDQAGNGDFTTIQAAVNAAAAGDTILINAGTYREQVVITGDRDGLTIAANAGLDPADVVIEAPDTANLQTTADTVVGGVPIQAVVTVDGVQNVTVTGVTVDGRGQGDASAPDTEFAGIVFTDADGGVVDTVVVTGVRYPLDGTFLSALPYGRAVYAASSSGDATFDLTNSIINDFQKAGVVLDGVIATITDNEISGSGLQPYLAQNGIDGFALVASIIAYNVISGLGYTAADGVDEGLGAGGINLFGGDFNIVDSNQIYGATIPTGVDNEAQPFGGFTGVTVVDLDGEPIFDIQVINNTIIGNGGDFASGITAADGAGFILVNNDLVNLGFGINVVGGGLVPLQTLVGGNTLDNVGLGLNFEALPGQDLNLNIDGTSEADFIATSDGRDRVRGRDGDDTIDGGAGNDNLLGELGNDTISGGVGADIVNGGAGTDTLLGGADEDFISGGADNDSIEGEAGNDDIFGNEGDDTILGGLGSDTISGSEGADSIDGGADNDDLFGDEGVDTVVGGAGEDTLDGGEGDDSLVGGAGDDVYFIDVAADLTVEEAGGGFDIVFTELTDTTLQAEIEGGAFVGQDAYTLTGNGLNNDLVGGDAGGALFGLGGLDTLVGGLGADTLDGGTDADVVQGGAGDDVYELDTAADVVIEEEDAGFDTVILTGVQTYVLADNVEVLEFIGTGPFDLTGNTIANEISVEAGSGVGSIFGDGGNDLIFGSDDANTLNGGTGNDTLEGGDGADTLTGAADNDSLEGGGGADSLVGLSGEDMVFGGVGQDTLAGSDGNDTLDGGDDNDLMRGATGNDSMVGGAGRDTLEGGADDDIINGGDGNDVVFGQAGNELILGGNGVDSLVGGLGLDTLNGGSSADRFVFQSITESTVGSGDIITQFGLGADRLVLFAIDANTGVAGDQRFTLLDKGTGFSGTAGELRYFQVGVNTRVQGDVNGDGTADFELTINNFSRLFTAADLEL